MRLKAFDKVKRWGRHSIYLDEQLRKCAQHLLVRSKGNKKRIKDHPCYLQRSEIIQSMYFFPATISCGLSHHLPLQHASLTMACEQNTSWPVHFSQNTGVPMKHHHAQVYICIGVYNQLCLPRRWGLCGEGTGTWIPPDTASGCVSATFEVLLCSAVQLQLQLTDGVSRLWWGLSAPQTALSNAAEESLHVQILAELGVILLTNSCSLCYPTPQKINLFRKGTLKKHSV